MASTPKINMATEPMKDFDPAADPRLTRYSRAIFDWILANSQKGLKSTIQEFKAGVETAREKVAKEDRGEGAKETRERELRIASNKLELLEIEYAEKQTKLATPAIMDEEFKKWATKFQVALKISYQTSALPVLQDRGYEAPQDEKFAVFFHTTADYLLDFLTEEHWEKMESLPDWQEPLSFFLYWFEELIWKGFSEQYEVFNYSRNVAGRHALYVEAWLEEVGLEAVSDFFLTYLDEVKGDFMDPEMTLSFHAAEWDRYDVELPFITYKGDSSTAKIRGANGQEITLPGFDAPATQDEELPA